MGRKVLVRFDSNYADEFDVEGFTVMPESKWNQHKDAITARFEHLPQTVDRWGSRTPELESYFGTNESLSWESLDDYFSCFTVTELSDSEYLVLKKFFSRGDTAGSGMVVMLEEEEDY